MKEMSDIFPIMKLLRRLADIRVRESVASNLRRRRFQLFKALLSAVDKKPLRILDVGGTVDFWKRMDFLAEEKDVELTVLNVFKAESPYSHVTCVVGDGTDMKEFDDGQFDVVFSNSVIEHVGGITRQKKMAAEVRRVGNAYYVQTPNLYFPMEPHFLFPFFQFLPVSLRAFLVKQFQVGWYGPTNDIQKARRTVTSVRLLERSELARFFPDGQVHRERLLGLTKSFVVLRPWKAMNDRKPQQHSECPTGASRPDSPVTESRDRVLTADGLGKKGTA